MTSKIIAVATAMVGVSLASAVGSAAPTSSYRGVAAGYSRLAHSPDLRPAQLAVRSQPGHSPPGAEHPAQPGGTAKRRTAVPAAAAWALLGRRVFGSGCRILLRRVPGSATALTTMPVAAGVSQVPGLSELAHAIERAGLTRTLDTAPALTIFAPDNAAFDALGAGNLAALLATTPDLVRVLKFHLVAGRVTPAQLAKHPVLTTLAGSKLDVTRFHRTFGVNNAAVTCGNVQMSNATVYIVSRVIVPAG